VVAYHQSRVHQDRLTAHSEEFSSFKRKDQMSLATKTPGAKRAGPEEYCFDLATIVNVHGGPDYTTATGPCIEGERMIAALMRMPAGTGAAPHSHPNEQWIYIVEGNFHATIGGKEFEGMPGTVLYIPPNVVHSVKATPRADGLFFTVKDASHGLQGVKA
jgi:quercetin dioxygenase-like cupin family protein